MPHHKADKRASQRVYFCMPAKYKLAGAKTYRQAIACEDLGGGGLRLSLPESVKAKGRMAVILFPQGPANPITAHCKMVWRGKCKDGKYDIGLEFLKIKEEDRFITFLCEKIIDFSMESR